MTNAVLNGKPYTKNPHVRFEVGGSRIGKPRRRSLYKTTGVVLGCLVTAFSSFAWDADTFAFYPFSGDTPFDNAAADSHHGVVTELSGGSVAIDPDDAPGKYVFEYGDGALPASIAEVPGAVHITGSGGYVDFQGLSGALGKCMAKSGGEATLEFFFKIPEGEVLRTWKASATLPGTYTISGTAYSELLFGLILDSSESAVNRVRFNYSMWGGGLNVQGAEATHGYRWHHVAVVYKNGGFSLYYDYDRRGTGMTCTVADPGEGADAEPFRFAGSLKGASTFLGKMSCLRASSKALPPEKFLRASDNDPRQLPSGLDLGSDTIAFYPFGEGAKGTAVSSGRILNAVNPSTRVGFVGSIETGASIVHDDDAPGKYVFTNFSYGAEAVYENPASVSFVGAVDNDGAHAKSGNINFSDIATAVAGESESTIEFFWKAGENASLPYWKSTVSLDLSVEGCTGELGVGLPLSIKAADADSVRKISLRDWGSNTGKCTYTYPNSLVDGLWHHFAITYSNGMVRMYCDYSAATETPNLPFISPAGSKPLRFGRDVFNGWVSCLRVSRRAYQPKDMLHVSNLSTCVPAEILRWRFEDQAAGGDISVVSNATVNYDQLNPQLYPTLPVQNGTVTSSTTAGDPKASATVWRALVLDPVTGSNDANVCSAYLPQAKLADGGIFAAGRGFASPASQVCDGSFTAETFFRVDYAAFLKNVYDVNPAKPLRVSILNSSISGSNTGAWNLYANSLVDSPYFQLDTTYADGTAGARIISKESTDLQKGKWYHCAVVYDAENLKLALYVNYEQVSEVVLDQKLATDKATAYNAGCRGNNQPFFGWIDEVRITHGVLDPSEFLKANRPPSGMLLLVR